MLNFAAARFLLATLLSVLVAFTINTSQSEPIYTPPLVGYASSVDANGNQSTGVAPLSGSFLGSTTTASASASESISNGSLIFNLNASVFGPGSSTASVALYAEIIGPRTVSKSSYIGVYLSETFSATGYQFYFGDCESCVPQNYGFAEGGINGAIACLGVAGLANPPSCSTFEGELGNLFLVTTNTPFAITALVGAIAVGDAYGEIAAQLNFSYFQIINYMPDLITDPQDYQLVIGPTISSLPSYYVSEPSTLELIEMGLVVVATILVKSRRRTSRS